MTDSDLYPVTPATRTLNKMLKTMTQRELAKMARTSQPAICNYANRRQRPRERIKKKLVKTLGIPFDAWGDS